MTMKRCSVCSGDLKGRWGNRCYTCTARPKTGETRQCAQCSGEFYVSGWQLRDVKRSQGKYCSLDCKHEALRFNPVGTPRWARRLLSEYGITYAQFLELNEKQDGLCAICHGGPNGPGGTRLQVDHCHETGNVRGLLCSKCNTAIGLLGERIELFERIADYLGPSVVRKPKE